MLCDNTLKKKKETTTYSIVHTSWPLSETAQLADEMGHI